MVATYLNFQASSQMKIEAWSFLLGHVLDIHNMLVACIFLGQGLQITGMVFIQPDQT